MIELPNFRPETRYGMPTADRYLFNRQYIVGYSYLFRQARWAMELIDSDTMKNWSAWITSARTLAFLRCSVPPKRTMRARDTTADT